MTSSGFSCFIDHLSAYFYEVSLQVFGTICYGAGCLYIVNLCTFYCVLDTSPFVMCIPCVTRSTRIFSNSVSWLLSLWTVSSDEQMPLILTGWNTAVPFSLTCHNVCLKCENFICSEAIVMSSYVFLQKRCCFSFYIRCWSPSVTAVCTRHEAMPRFSLPWGHPVDHALVIEKPTLLFHTASDTCCNLGDCRRVHVSGLCLFPLVGAPVLAPTSHALN